MYEDLRKLIKDVKPVKDKMMSAGLEYLLENNNWIHLRRTMHHESISFHIGRNRKLTFYQFPDSIKALYDEKYRLLYDDYNYFMKFCLNLKFNELNGKSRTAALGKRQTLLVIDSEMCQWCGSKDNLTIDHRVPMSLGGDNSFYNLQLLCKNCNQMKSNAKEEFTQREWKYLRMLHKLYETLEKTDNISLTQFCKENKISSIVSTVIYNGGLVRSEGNRRNHIVKWNTHRPNIHMARKLIDEVKKYQDNSYKKVKSRADKAVELSERKPEVADVVVIEKMNNQSADNGVKKEVKPIFYKEDFRIPVFHGVFTVLFSNVDNLDLSSVPEYDLVDPNGDNVVNFGHYRDVNVKFNGTLIHGFGIQFNLVNKWAKVNHGVIAHEVFHTASQLMRCRDTKHGVKTEEAYAYIVQWMTDRVYEVIEKYGIEIGTEFDRFCLDNAQ